MATVTFKVIPRSAVLDEGRYNWLISKLGTPLPLAAVSWRRTGEVAAITVFTPEDGIAVVFTYGYTEIEYEVNLHANNNNR